MARTTPNKLKDKTQEPNKCKQWKSITDPENIEHYMIIRNQQYFIQAQGPQFTEGKLAEDIDWTTFIEAV